MTSIGKLCPKQFFLKELLLSLSLLLLGLGVGVKLTRKGLPAVSWHWQASPKPFFPKELLLSLWLLLGLGGRWCEACSEEPAGEELALASFAEAILSKRIVVVVVVVVGLWSVGAKLARKGLPAASWHWQALLKPYFSKRIVVVVVVVVGLGGVGRSLLEKACPR